MIGQSIAHYEILAKIGEGGMGVVYRARDTKLGRDVALKVLPEQFARDPQRMGRFEREARVLASLNHPNIAAIHGLEEQNGVHALVMELVEGLTLADRIDEGAIPLDEALQLARQIADALEYAHERGVVHRDLKPANVKLTADGAVKVLDFGLAKAMTDESSVSDPENSPTLTIGATRAGMILGTAAYMAPEQARGKRVDKRADIWSFGVVLYEMVTGQRLFSGEDLTDTLAMVVRERPDLSAAPAQVRRLLGRCLEKDPKKRLRDIGDVWELLEEEPQQAAAQPAPSRWLWPALAAVATMAAVAFALLWLLQPAPELRKTQFTLDPPPETTFSGLEASTAASPDGRYLVFSAGVSEETPSLWLRPLDSLGARPLPGTEGGSRPFWSPDSSMIAFFADGRLKRVDIAGGAPLVLCDAVNFTSTTAGGTWSPDGVILFGSGDGLYSVPESGGVPELLTISDASRGEGSHGFPQFLPDGRSFLYFIRSDDPDTRGVYAASLDRPDQRVRILATERKAVYAPPVAAHPGYLLWMQEEALWAQAFDAGNLRLEGQVTPVAESVLASFVNSGAAFWTSDAGLLVYRTGGADVGRTMTWFSRDGERLGEAGQEERYGDIRLSPDGGRAAVTILDEQVNQDIWLFDFGREVMTRLTFDAGRDQQPAWSPDGSQIAFRSDRSGVYQLYRKDVSGAGEVEQLTEGPNQKSLSDWSRDGRDLLYLEQSQETGFDIWVLPLEGDREPVLVRQTRFRERGARFSPDGNWIAYVSDESGRDEIYVQAFPPSGGKWQVSNQGGERPKWSSDGEELYYFSGDGRTIMAASIRTTGGSIESDTPHELVQVGAPIASVLSPYDVTADGQRFVVLDRLDSGEAEVPLTVVDNWQAGLGQ